MSMVIDEWDGERRVRHDTSGPNGSTHEKAYLAEWRAQAEADAYEREPSAGDWRPDEIDQRVRTVIEHRDRVAHAVDGPVPVFGSPEWATAVEQV